MNGLTEKTNAFIEIFFIPIQNYNSSTWIFQLIILLVGIVLTVLIYRNPTKIVRVVMKAFLAFGFGWISIMYFIVNGRAVSSWWITATFFATISIGFIVDIFMDKIKFERNKRYDIISGIFYILYLSYPLMSMILGREFPSLITWIMPCPFTVFATTLLLSHFPKINYPLFMLLTVWGITGIPKGLFVWEDLILAFSGITACIVLIKEHKVNNKDDAQ